MIDETDNEWDLKIIKIKNGFLMVFRDYDEESGEPYIENIAITEDENDNKEGNFNDEHKELVAAKKMLEAVLNHFGPHGNKHDPYRIRVVLCKRQMDEGYVTRIKSKGAK